MDSHFGGRSLRGGPRGRELAAVRGDCGVQSRGGALILALQLLQPRLQLRVPADEVCASYWGPRMCSINVGMEWI